MTELSSPPLFYSRETITQYKMPPLWEQFGARLEMNSSILSLYNLLLIIKTRTNRYSAGLEKKSPFLSLYDISLIIKTGTNRSKKRYTCINDVLGKFPAVEVFL